MYVLPWDFLLFLLKDPIFKIDLFFPFRSLLLRWFSWVSNDVKSAYFILFLCKIHYLKSAFLYAAFRFHLPVLNVYSKNTKLWPSLCQSQKFASRNTQIWVMEDSTYMLYLYVLCGKCNHPIERCLTFRTILIKAVSFLSIRLKISL